LPLISIVPAIVAFPPTSITTGVFTAFFLNVTVTPVGIFTDV